MRKLLTNCPNCGAPLRSDGYCEYCKTKIRYANEVELSRIGHNIKPIEILLKFQENDGTVFMPVRGYVDTIEINRELESAYYYEGAMVTNRLTQVSFVFNGYIE